jgi:hypothetical protein
MRMRRLFLVLAVLAIGHGAMGAQDASGDLLGRVNNLRSSLGLAPYNINGALSAAAQSQAQWMADNSLISHNRPDGSGPRSRAIASGYPSADVAENIYGGTNATLDAAWSFWVNSAIHYAGLTNTRYQEIGIGAARGSDFTTYTLVFGNPGGPAPGQRPVVAGGGGNAESAPPSYVLGLNEHGFIMHQVQPGDTLGDIALLYGYTWDDIPYMKTVNEINDNRSLEIGAVFLVPPYDGTFTPTPGGLQATATPEVEDAEVTEQAIAFGASATPVPTRSAIATSAAMPEVLALVAAEHTAEPVAVAAVATQPAPRMNTADRSGTITRKGSPPWLAIALTVQVGLLLVAGVEFARRSRRKKQR